MKVLFISLGCDKNLVDSEMMMGLLNERGYEFTDDEMLADVIVVNTCGFINDAKEESTCEGDLVQNLADIICSGSALTNAGDCAALLLQIVGYLNRVEGDLRIEVRKANDQDEEHSGIEPTVRTQELCELAPEVGLG